MKCSHQIEQEVVLSRVERVLMSVDIWQELVKDVILVTSHRELLLQAA